MKRVFAIAALCLLFAAPARAADASEKPAPAAIDFTQYLLDENGKPFEDSFLFDRREPDKKLPDTTLGAAACHALNAGTKDEENLAFDKRLERGNLCLKIKGAVNAVLESGDVDLIKKRIGAVYTNSVFVLRASCMLDPAFAAKTDACRVK